MEIKAYYEDHLTSWSSTIGVPDLYHWDQTYGKDIVGIGSDNTDGTYASQITIYRSGTYRLEVKVNDDHIENSPFESKILVKPTELYAPACVMKDVPR